MKRTILATAIIATSFGSVAGIQDRVNDPIGIDHGTVQKINAFNTVMSKAGHDAHIMPTADGYVLVANVNGDSKIDQIDLSNPDNVDSILTGLKKQANVNMMTRRDERKGGHDVIIDPNLPEFGVDPIIDPINPVQPIAGNPDAIKAHAQTVVTEWKDGLSNSEKKAQIENAAFKNGYQVTVHEASQDGVAKMTFTSYATGEEVTVSAEEFNEYMTAKQEERQAERELETEPKLPNDNAGKARDALVDGLEGLAGSGKALTEAGKAAAQNAATQQNQIDELYALGNQNASDIDTLFGEVDRLDTRIDQTQALNAATVNARPMVTNGMTAFGAGVGYAGSEAALAIGVAHSFVDTGWSASGTLAASSDDVVVGAGAQYAF
ncbi:MULTISPECIES: YadA C-terminal domain-containing protein [unclassified Vibrio]|uniref:YadA C-terminal domain-containing protein n=1 Tax=unclassified Vibrio TaxID=2614977 RepID=UPI00159D6E7C|nr:MULTISPECIES: YadA C-terminal domain-containing protein [unclassified Vibrio]